MYRKPLLTSLVLTLTIVAVSLSVLSPRSAIPVAVVQAARVQSTLTTENVLPRHPLLLPVVKPRKARHHHPRPRRVRKRITHAVVVARPVATPTHAYVAPVPSPTHQVASNLAGAAKAVAFAFAQIGCPYVYAGIGPCSSGFDCSGLVQAAWQSAGTEIPRTSYGQWSGLPHVSTSELEPGDILVFYSGASHVGLYVGGGYMIDASHSGVPVQKVSLAGYYSSHLIGAVRP